MSLKKTLTGRFSELLFLSRKREPYANVTAVAFVAVIVIASVNVVRNLFVFAIA
jgi:hypothetical protein